MNFESISLLTTGILLFMGNGIYFLAQIGSGNACIKEEVFCLTTFTILLFFILSFVLIYLGLEIQKLNNKEMQEDE